MISRRHVAILGLIILSASSVSCADQFNAFLRATQLERVARPTQGDPKDERVIEVAREIEKVDQLLAHWRETTSGDSSVLDAMEAVARELRTESQLELEKGRFISSQTFDRDSYLLAVLFRDAKDTAALAARVLQSPPAASRFCRTEIDAAPEGATVHYMSRAEFIQGSQDWRSYTSGETLSIGRYQFRVDPQEQTSYFETVLVLSDPFRKQLRPTGSQAR